MFGPCSIRSVLRFKAASCPDRAFPFSELRRVQSRAPGEVPAASGWKPPRSSASRGQAARAFPRCCEGQVAQSYCRASTCAGAGIVGSSRGRRGEGAESRRAAAPRACRPGRPRAAAAWRAGHGYGGTVRQRRASGRTAGGQAARRPCCAPAPPALALRHAPFGTTRRAGSGRRVGQAQRGRMAGRVGSGFGLRRGEAGRGGRARVKSGWARIGSGADGWRGGR